MRIYMKLFWLFIMLFLIVSCKSNSFSTPESTILTLEKDIHKTRNATLYISKTYFSDYVVSQVGDLISSPVVEKDENGNYREVNDSEILLEFFKNQLIENTGWDLPENEVESIDFTNKEIIDKDHVVLDYTINYLPENNGYAPTPRKDRTFFVKIWKEWLIDIEPEWVEKGILISKEESEAQPPIPSNLKDCGIELHPIYFTPNISVRQCFYDSYQECIPAKMTWMTGGGHADITIILWTEKSNDACIFHLYIDSRDRYGAMGKFYNICPEVDTEQSIDIDWTNKSYWTFKFDLDICEKGEGFRDHKDQYKGYTNHTFIV